MTTSDYIAPEHKKRSFHCPCCGVLAHQTWPHMFYRYRESSLATVPRLTASICTHCQGFAFWLDDGIIHPSSGIAPLPHPKMPEPIKADYEEARSIASVSPRGAAALLRLCIQKLCIHLGQPGDKLSQDIAALVRGGLPAGVQQALDVVRVTGNHAVHPGQIDLNDQPEITNSLFMLVNLITAKMIAEPEELARLYQGLPEKERKRIEKRDGATQSGGEARPAE